MRSGPIVVSSCLSCFAFGALGPSAARGGEPVPTTGGGEGPRTVTEFARITPSDGYPVAFGASIAVSADDLVVGAPGYITEDGMVGAAYVFHRVGPRWIETATLVPDLGGIDGGDFGHSVADGGLCAGCASPQPDCQLNGIPDECQTDGPDCDADGVPDTCAIACGPVGSACLAFACGAATDCDNDCFHDGCRACLATVLGNRKLFGPGSRRGVSIPGAKKYRLFYPPKALLMCCYSRQDHGSPDAPPRSVGGSPPVRNGKPEPLPVERWSRGRPLEALRSPDWRNI